MLCNMAEQEIKEEIDALRTRTSTKVRSEDMESIAVVWGLTGHDSIEDVKKWIADELWTAYGPQPFIVYCIGEFKNIAFAKFHSQQDRDDAVIIFETLKKNGNGNVWAKIHQPLEDRVFSSFLGGLRWLLGEWG